MEMFRELYRIWMIIIQFNAVYLFQTNIVLQTHKPKYYIEVRTKLTRYLGLG